MGNKKQNTPSGPLKRDMPVDAHLIEWTGTEDAIWKVICVACREWFRRHVRGTAEGKMWYAIQSKEQICDRCYEEGHRPKAIIYEPKKLLPLVGPLNEAMRERFRNMK